MRFAQLTLFVAATAALISVLFGEGALKSPGVCLALKIGGLITVAVFYVMEHRSGDYFHYYRRRARELEKVLGYSQYIHARERKVFTATNAVRFLFAACAVFWLLMLFMPSWF